MKSFAMTLDLRDDPEVIAEYRRYHREVWPEVIEGLRSVGILKMKIFLKETRMFMYIETEDDFEPARDFQAYTDASPTGARVGRADARIPGEGSGRCRGRMVGLHGRSVRHRLVLVT